MMNQRHYNKEKLRMGGEVYLDGMIPYRILTPEEINGHKTIDPVQETIDSLNAAIDRLDQIINEMKGQANGNNK